MKRRLLVGSVCIVAAAAGCSKKDSKSDSESASTQVGEVNIDTDPLAALNLSASLSPEVPVSVTAKGTGVQPGQVAVVALTERKKSREACNIRQKIREAKMNEEQVGLDLCLIQSQNGTKAGGKYKMKFKMTAPDMGGGPGGDTGSPNAPGDMPGGSDGAGGFPGADGGMEAGGADMGGFPLTQGPGADGGMGDMSMERELSVFLDNSDPANFKVFTCEGGKLTQKIVLNGAKSQGAKGNYKASFDMGGLAVAMVGSFDSSEPGRQRSASQMSFSIDTGNFKAKMRSNMSLDLSKDGISIVKVANEDSGSSDSFSAAGKEIGVALVGPNLGSALFQRTFTGSGSFGPAPGEPLSLTQNSVQNVETSRAFFDSAGQTLELKDSASFAEGGKLHVTEAMFPKLLPENFAVTFDADDWDCSGAEDFEVVENKELKACNARFTSPFIDEECDGSIYAVGFEEEFPPFIDQRDEFGPPVFGDLPPGLDDFPPPQ